MFKRMLSKTLGGLVGLTSGFIIGGIGTLINVWKALFVISEDDLFITKCLLGILCLGISLPLFFLGSIIGAIRGAASGFNKGIGDILPSAKAFLEDGFVADLQHYHYTYLPNQELQMIKQGTKAALLSRLLIQSNIEKAEEPAPLLSLPIEMKAKIASYAIDTSILPFSAAKKIARHAAFFNNPIKEKNRQDVREFLHRLRLV